MNDNNDHHEDEDDDARPPHPEEDDNDNNDPPTLRLLPELLHQLRLILQHNQEDGHVHYNEDDVIDIEKAKNVLEATAGDVATAAQLYWDDFLATHHHQQQQQQVNNGNANNNNNNNAQQQQDSSDDDNDEEEQEEAHDDDDDDDDDDNAPLALARHRNILADDDDHDNDESSTENNNNEEVPEINGDRNIALELRRRLFPNIRNRNNRRNNRRQQQQQQEDNGSSDNDSDDDGDDDSNHEEEEDDNRNNNNNNNNGGVSVSSDEDDNNDDRDNNNFWNLAARHPLSSSNRKNNKASNNKKKKHRRSDNNDDNSSSGRNNNNNNNKRRKLLHNQQHPKQQKQVSSKKGMDEETDIMDMDDDDSHDDDDGYLSDHDWLWETLDQNPNNTDSCNDNSNNSTTTTTQHASEILWGLELDAANNKKKKKTNDDDDDGEDEQQKPVVGIPWTWLNAGFHLAASTTTTTGSSTENASNKNKKSARVVDPYSSKEKGGDNSVPLHRTTTTGVGLAVRSPPHEDDLGYQALYSRNNTNTNTSSGGILPSPPYHCRAVTALLSVVTALFYSGAAPQECGGNSGSCCPSVSCATPNMSFLELIKLSDEQRWQRQKQQQQQNDNNNNNKKQHQQHETVLYKRKFESRLADALSALLLVAARASKARKELALEELRTSPDPNDQRKWQKLQRRLQLVPTCWWEQDAESGEIVIPTTPATGAGKTHCDMPIAVSYTNIDDLRSYVLGNMRAFTSSGGCALFLETIVRIHGRGAILRMIRQARAANTAAAAAEAPQPLPADSLKAPLVNCTCLEQHEHKMEADPKWAQKIKAEHKKSGYVDTTPHGHDCCSIELLSLLLTGRVHSTLKNWSTDPLGIGILSDQPGEVGRGLTRPDKPVWILRGPTSYSVLWLNGCNDDANSFSKTDRPGSVAEFTHWNCFQGGRRETRFYLVTDRSKNNNKPPKVTDGEDDDDLVFEQQIAEYSSTALKQLARRRRDDQKHASDVYNVETTDPALVVTHRETDAVVANPDDQKFYPGKFRMWRYSMVDGGGGNGSDDNNKNTTPKWCPYFSMSEREKLVVETKWGPKLSTILWTRWPRATIDRFQPGHPPAVV